MPRGLSVYDSAALQGRLWTPQEFCPLLWLDASDISSISIATGVSQWRDKSGNGLDVSQSTGANQPSFVQNGINGRSAIDWGSSLNSRNLYRSVSGYSPARYYGVADYDGANPSAGYATLYGHNFSVPVDVLQVNLNSTNWYPGSSSVQTFLNGSSNSSFTCLPTISDPFVFGTDNGTSFNRTDLWIGSDRALSNRGWVGKIGEIISLRSIPNSRERSIIEGYLAWKWGLAGSLLSTHPFYNRPPLIGG